jgi:hypothetical protein
VELKCLESINFHTEICFGPRRGAEEKRHEEGVRVKELREFERW